MTGYGKTVVAYKGKKINVEIKSLNSKQLDLTTRIAPLYREKEMEIRQMIAEQLQRGKVEFAIWIEKGCHYRGCTCQYGADAELSLAVASLCCRQ